MKIASFNWQKDENENIASFNFNSEKILPFNKASNYNTKKLKTRTWQQKKPKATITQSFKQEHSIKQLNQKANDKHIPAQKITLKLEHAMQNGEWLS